MRGALSAELKGYMEIERNLLSLSILYCGFVQNTVGVISLSLKYDINIIQVLTERESLCLYDIHFEQEHEHVLFEYSLILLTNFMKG